MGSARQDQSHGLPQPRPRRAVCRRDRACPSHRHAGRYRRWCATITPTAPASASIWSSKSPRRSASLRAPAGLTAPSSLGISPTSTAPSSGGVSINGKAMGPARRHDRHRRRRQWHCRRAPGLFQRRRERHPDRRRAIAASQRRRNCRSLLQLRADRFDAGFGRLSIRRQSRLQYRPRASKCFCRPPALAVLSTEYNSLRLGALSRTSA